MNDEKIVLVYVDDNIQPQLSEYLNTIKTDLFIYKEIEFNVTSTYDNLIEQIANEEANIVIIDSKLFENCSVREEKYSGEELMIILKKILPFIETIVISQNDDIDNIGFIRKFQSTRDTTSKDSFIYYNDKLLDKIMHSKRVIEVSRIIKKKIEDSKYIDKYLIENINNNIAGLTDYDGLKKSDIDRLIEAFKMVEKKYEKC